MQTVITRQGHVQCTNRLRPQGPATKAQTQAARPDGPQTRLTQGKIKAQKWSDGDHARKSRCRDILPLEGYDLPTEAKFSRLGEIEGIRPQCKGCTQTDANEQRLRKTCGISGGLDLIVSMGMGFDMDHGGADLGKNPQSGGIIASQHVPLHPKFGQIMARLP
jgi:hypothetical protein